MTAQWVREKIQKAEAEISAGRLWRAKEILRGSIGSASYALEPDLLEAYGRLLDQLGDRYEAGKYLFLSGKDSPNYEQAVALYLNRNRRAAASELIAQFPRAIRHHGLGHLPENARHILEQKGADARELERVDPLPYGVRISVRKERTVVTIFIGVLLLSLFLMIVGFVTVIQWII